MKRILIILIAVLASCSKKEQPAAGEFLVKGKFSSITSPMIVKLNYTDDRNLPIMEEVISKNGEFSFKGKTTASGAELLFMPYHPTYKLDTKEYWEFAMKELKKMQYKSTRSFFLESGCFEFEGEELGTARLSTSSNNQQLYSQFRKQSKELRKVYFDLSDKRIQDSTTGNKTKLAETEKALKEQQLKIDDFSYDFVRKNYDNKVGLVVLKSETVYGNPEKLQSGIDGLSKELQNTPLSTYLREIAQTAFKNKTGNMGADFALQDPTGQKRSLSDFKGRYVLVDFWSSGCGPCRAENPNVVKAYNKFKGENFDIIFISMDNNKKEWLKAVQEDKLPWLNLLDNYQSKQSVAAAYGVLFIPSNFLLDPSGKIIAKNLRGKELHDKLAETFSKK